MEAWSELEPWWRFGAALLVGALIGLEREFVQQRSGAIEFGGIRTFSLMALVGAASAYYAAEHGPLLFVVAYLGIALLLLSSHLSSSLRGHEEGITTEVAALLVPLLAAMIIWGRVEIGVALGVVTALLLALKPRLHGMARRMTPEDLRATLEFALISAVILPLLPNRGFGPFEVLNPFRIWLLVVLVSGIGFAGYLLIKLLGAARGVGLTGLLGGLVSSTATTVSFAARSKHEHGLRAVLTQGILLASAVMLPRVLVWVAAVHPPLLARVAPPLGVMFAANLAIVVVLWRRARSGPAVEQRGVEFGNPLKLRTAVSFGLVFALVLVAVRAAYEFFGSAGVYVASALAALTDVDSITLSTSQLAGRGQLSLEVAAVAIVLAALVNTAAKGVLAWSLGSPGLRRLAVPAFGLVLAAGAAAGAIWLWPVG